MNIDEQFRRHLLEQIYSGVLSVPDYFIVAGKNAFKFIMQQPEASTETDRKGKLHYFFRDTEVITNPSVAEYVVFVAKKREYPAIFFGLEEA